VTTSVDASVPGNTVTNIAVVSGGGDSNPGNNTASDQRLSTLRYREATSRLRRCTVEPAVPGQIVTTVTVKNVGASASSGGDRDRTRRQACR
jgi:hypothetical protein